MMHNSLDTIVAILPNTLNLLRPQEAHHSVFLKSRDKHLGGKVDQCY